MLLQQFSLKTRNLLPYFNASLGQVRACGKEGESLSPPLQPPMRLLAMGLFTTNRFHKKPFVLVSLKDAEITDHALFF